MSFAKIKEQSAAHYRALDELEFACTREWVCPDNSIIVLRVSPTFDGNHTLTFERWVPQEGARRLLRNGKHIEGGYTEYMHDAYRYISSQRLEWMAKARRLAEQWVAGEIDHLPEQLF